MLHHAPVMFCMLWAVTESLRRCAWRSRRSSHMPSASVCGRSLLGTQPGLPKSILSALGHGICTWPAGSAAHASWTVLLASSFT
eukprot:10836180-Alexandrium_andersonii.AAC.1